MILNDKVKELIRLKEEQEQFIHQILYTKGKEDLWIFNKFILNVEGNASSVPLAPFHKQLCRFVTDDKKKKKLILIPRGHLKSTLITIGYSVQQIVNNPNIRILILNATWQMAVDFVSEIKRHLTSNQQLIDLYGDLTVGREEWSQDRFTLHRTDTGIKGPTVWGAGIDSNLVGSHPDMIILDDVQNRDNTTTREQIEKVILRYKDALDLLEPGGQLIVIGTRWVEGDLYSWITDKEGQITKSYDVMIKRAYEGSIETGEDFNSLWPEKFTKEELQDRLREKGWYEFSAQYMNNPVPSEDADFKKEWFQYYDIEDFRGKQMKTVLTIDPAISLNKDADYTAMVTTGIDAFSNLFIKDIVRKRMKPSEIIDAIFFQYELWHPQMIVIETIAYQKALAYALREEMQKRHRFLPIYEVNTQEKSKDQRIRGLQPLYMGKKVFHRNGIPQNIYFEEELLTFPRGRHDDMIDAFSMSLDYLRPPKQEKKRYQHQYLY